MATAENTAGRWKDLRLLLPVMAAIRARNESEQNEDWADEPNWIYDNLKMRVCYRFVSDPKDATKCGCGAPRTDHSDSPRPEDTQPAQHPRKWTVDENTVEEPTNAFGELAFVNQERFAKYVRVSSTTDMKAMMDLLFKVWKLERPKLIISVTGGAMDFRMPRALSTKFRAGLMKVAQSTGAWIITGGTRIGVMQHVGRAVKTNSIRSANASPVVCLGVATWGILCESSALTNHRGCYDSDRAQYHIPIDYRQVQQRSRGAFLDPYHTHFLLVDNGTKSKFGVEIGFRASLEAKIAQLSASSDDDSLHIPICCVILEGGPGSLETVMSAAKLGTPIIIAKGSGRVANVLAEAYEHLESQDKQAVAAGNAGKKLFDEAVESHFHDLLRSLAKEATAEQVSLWFSWLQQCMMHRHMMTVVHQDSDLDLAILYALLSTKKRQCKAQLQLSIAWNRIDAARDILKSASVDEGRLKSVLADVAISSITLNRVEFVEEFMNHGLKAHLFLSVFALSRLYNSLPVDSVLRKLLLDNEDGAVNLREVGKLINKLLGDLRGHSYINDLRYSHMRHSQVTNGNLNALVVDEGDSATKGKSSGTSFKLRLNSFHKFGRPLIHSKFVNGHPASSYRSHVTYGDLTRPASRLHVTAFQDDRGSTELSLPHFDDPWFELFTYAVLLDRRDLAMVFFRKVTEPLIAVLMACRLCIALHKHADDTEQRQSFTSDASFYESVAIRLLNTCYASLPTRAQALLIRKVGLLNGRTCLQLAHAASCRAFMSQPCCQALMKRTWFGSISGSRLPNPLSVIACCFFPPLIFVIPLEFKRIDSASLVHPKSAVTKSASRVVAPALTRPRSMSNLASAQQRKSEPANIQHTTAKLKIQEMLSSLQMFYNVPLVVFAYRFFAYFCFLTLISFHALIEYGSDLLDNGFFIDVILILWISSLLLDEIIQACTGSGEKLYRLRKYIGNIWNMIMLSGIAFFLISHLLLLVSVSNVGRVFNALGVLLFYVRALQWFAVHKRLGPIVVVAGRMIVELCFFMILLFLLVFGWGVAQYSLLFPNSPASWSIVRDLLMLSYWQMHGDLHTEVIGQKPFDGFDLECTDDPALYSNYTMKRCPDATGQTTVPILLAAFVLSTNLLMFNLLIAIFNYCYEKVKEETEQVWCFQRYELVTEFNGKSAIVPPFALLSHAYTALLYSIKKTSVKLKKSRGLRVLLAISLREVDDAEVRLWQVTQRDDLITQYSQTNEHKSA